MFTAGFSFTTRRGILILSCLAETKSIEMYDGLQMVQSIMCSKIDKRIDVGIQNHIV